MDKSTSLSSILKVSTVPQETFKRFDIYQRIEHIVFLLSFTLLGITGLVQKFSVSTVSLTILRAFGGIENARQVHHISAIVMMWVTVYHIISVAYRIFVLRTPLSMLPLLEDFKHLFQDIKYNLGIRKHKAYYGRYNYAEKVEYLAVVWGTIIMGITGFIMWNPITTTKFLPGETIPAAKAAHGGEAVLAVMAIIIWHFYHVHIRRFNKSMFTGRITREEMQHEHPAELAEIETSQNWSPPARGVLRKRQLIFAPISAALVLILTWGIIEFITIEPQTALTTIPQRESATVFVPITPTPRPTLVPIPTAEVSEDVLANSWEGSFAALFNNRCGTCHVHTAVGGLSLAYYQDALKGGKSGSAIVPGDPDASILVQIQSTGNHAGQLSIDELNTVIEWIEAGAPER